MRTDNVFVFSLIMSRVIRCIMWPDKRPARSDHILVVMEVDLLLEEWVEPLHPNFRSADWKKVRETLSGRLEELEAGKTVNTHGEFFFWLGKLTHMILGIIEDCILKVGMLPYQQHWWSPLLSARCMELRRVTQRAYSRRSELEDPVHLEQRAARRAYGLKSPRENTGRGSWCHLMRGQYGWHIVMPWGLQQTGGQLGYPHSEEYRMLACQPW